jgi:hypothetical protein
MKTEREYRYVLLRYEHDVRTEEFLNLGVLFWVPSNKELKFRYTENKSRLSAVFPDSNPSEVLQCVKELTARSERLEVNACPDAELLTIAHSILPKDDSSLRWSRPSAGVTDSIESTLEEVYHDLVTRYEHKRTRAVRSNTNVWKDFEFRLKPHHVLHLISQTVVRSPMRKYEFDHSWRNHRRHIIAPVSLDAEKPEGIADKATEWTGRILDLNRSTDEFTLALLLGKPQKREFLSEYQSAVELLKNKTKSDRMKVISAAEVDAFASRTLEEMKAHIRESASSQ